MNKLCVPKADIKMFHVTKIRNLEGCPHAARFLYKHLGFNTYDMRTNKPYFVDLIMRHDKPDWAINFLLNLMKIKYRIEFIEKQLIESMEFNFDLIIADDVMEAFNYFKKGRSVKAINHNKAKLQSHLDRLNKALQDHSINLSLPPVLLAKYQREASVLEAMKFITDDSDKNFTRNVTDALMKLAEAKAWSDLVSYNYDDIIKSYALDLMEFTGIWQEN